MRRSWVSSTYQLTMNNANSSTNNTREIPRRVSEKRPNQNELQPNAIPILHLLLLEKKWPA